MEDMDFYTEFKNYAIQVLDAFIEQYGPEYNDDVNLFLTAAQTYNYYLMITKINELNEFIHNL